MEKLDEKKVCAMAISISQQYILRIYEFHNLRNKLTAFGPSELPVLEICIAIHVSFFPT